MADSDDRIKSSIFQSGLDAVRLFRGVTKEAAEYRIKNSVGYVPREYFVAAETGNSLKKLEFSFVNMTAKNFKKFSEFCESAGIVFSGEWDKESREWSLECRESDWERVRAACYEFNNGELLKDLRKRIAEYEIGNINELSPKHKSAYADLIEQYNDIIGSHCYDFNDEQGLSLLELDIAAQMPIEKLYDLKTYDFYETMTIKTGRETNRGEVFVVADVEDLSTHIMCKGNADNTKDPTTGEEYLITHYTVNKGGKDVRTFDNNRRNSTPWPVAIQKMKEAGGFGDTLIMFGSIEEYQQFMKICNLTPEKHLDLLNRTEPNRDYADERENLERELIQKGLKIVERDGHKILVGRNSDNEEKKNPEKLNASREAYILARERRNTIYGMYGERNDTEEYAKKINDAKEEYNRCLEAFHGCLKSEYSKAESLCIFEHIKNLEELERTSADYRVARVRLMAPELKQKDKAAVKREFEACKAAYNNAQQAEVKVMNARKLLGAFMNEHELRNELEKLNEIITTGRRVTGRGYEEVTLDELREELNRYNDEDERNGGSGYDDSSGSGGPDDPGDSSLDNQKYESDFDKMRAKVKNLWEKFKSGVKNFWKVFLLLDETEYDDSDEPEHDDSDEPEHDDSDEPEHDDSDEPEHDDSDEPEHDDSDEPEHDDSDDPEHDDSDDPEHDDSDEPEHDDSDEPEHDDSEHPEHNNSDEPESGNQDDPIIMKLIDALKQDLREMGFRFEDGRAIKNGKNGMPRFNTAAKKRYIRNNSVALNIGQEIANLYKINQVNKELNKLIPLIDNEKTKFKYEKMVAEYYKYLDIQYAYVVHNRQLRERRAELEAEPVEPVRDGLIASAKKWIGKLFTAIPSAQSPPETQMKASDEAEDIREQDKYLEDKQEASGNMSHQQATSSDENLKPDPDAIKSDHDNVSGLNSKQENPVELYRLVVKDNPRLKEPLARNLLQEWQNSVDNYYKLGNGSSWEDREPVLKEMRKWKKACMDYIEEGIFVEQLAQEPGYQSSQEISGDTGHQQENQESNVESDEVLIDGDDWEFVYDPFDINSDPGAINPDNIQPINVIPDKSNIGESGYDPFDINSDPGAINPDNIQPINVIPDKSNIGESDHDSSNIDSNSGDIKPGQGKCIEINSSHVNKQQESPVELYRLSVERYSRARHITFRSLLHHWQEAVNVFNNPMLSRGDRKAAFKATEMWEAASKYYIEKGMLPDFIENGRVPKSYKKQYDISPIVQTNVNRNAR